MYLWKPNIFIKNFGGCFYALLHRYRFIYIELLLFLLIFYYEEVEEVLNKP